MPARGEVSSGSTRGADAANFAADQTFVLVARTAADKKVAPSTRRNASAILLRLAANYDLFHSADGTGFADININGHRETLAIQSDALKNRLKYDYYKHTAEAPPREALGSAIGILEAKATFEGPERSVHVRVAEHNGCLFLDLADPERRAVEITIEGWRIVSNPSVRFYHPGGMLALPAPQPGGSINDFKPFLNVRHENDFVLIVAWLMAAFRPFGPYPMLAVAGEQGSAKSSLSKVVRNLIDPNVSPLRSMPKNHHDFFIAAKNSHVSAFDNISSIPSWASDTLCQLATGAGYVTRQLRTDQDQVFFEVSRPVILNGIEEFVDRPDLADRSIFVSLQQISNHRPEEELRNEFNRAWPRILGALLDGVAHGLRTLPDVRLNDYPRMADFAKFATACEGAFWSPSTFSAAYSVNRARAIEALVEADPIASALRELTRGRSEWVGTATNLWTEGRPLAGPGSDWPKTPRLLSRRLTRLQPALRTFGIEITRDRVGRGGTRVITITGGK